MWGYRECSESIGSGILGLVLLNIFYFLRLKIVLKED